MTIFGVLRPPFLVFVDPPTESIFCVFSCTPVFVSTFVSMFLGSVFVSLFVSVFWITFLDQGGILYFVPNWFTFLFLFYSRPRGCICKIVRFMSCGWVEPNKGG